MSIDALIIIAILALPVFFLLREIFKRFEIGKKTHRNHIAIILTLVSTPILYVGMMVFWYSSISNYPQAKFNSNQWHQNGEERYKMSRNIINSKILIGKTKNEVIEVLGEEYYSLNDNSIQYKLGYAPRLLNISPDVLYIYFENDTVVNVKRNSR